MPVDVLAIGAHMGDEVAWGMALAACKRQGLSTGMLHLTPGEKGHPTLDPETYAAQKRQEAAACAETLGAQVWTLDYRDGELPADDTVKMQIAAVLREARPKRIITHWPGSMHKDHTNAALNLPDAQFYAAIRHFDLGEQPAPFASTLHGENWEDLRGYIPEVYLALTREDLDLYERAMRRYALFRAEWKTFAYLDYYLALARTRGCEIFTDYACTFAIPAEQRRKRLTSLIE